MTPPKLSAEDIPYKPRSPESYRPGIGLIGCGGITEHHLTAYQNAGYDVVAFCDIQRDLAEQRRQSFYPQARVYSNSHELLGDPQVEVVDIATHTDVRGPIIRSALEAGKHVLSQKPFVTDLDEGIQLADLAENRGLHLAVNQNGRWAPHFSYARHIVLLGLLGEITSVDMSVHWDHSWVVGTKFETMRHLVLYDFAIHWFDIVRCLFGDRPAHQVFASSSMAVDQPIREPLLAQAAIQFANGQASLQFDGFTKFGGLDRMVVTGTRGMLESSGANYLEQQVKLTTEHGQYSPSLEGCWFPDGFHGTLGELLCSIEEQRDCTLNARDNLSSLELCFAAVASQISGQPMIPGSVRRLPP